MNLAKKISSANELGGNFMTVKIEDGKVFIPIPLQTFTISGVRLDLPILVTGLDIGGIYVFNPGIQNPDLVRALIPPLKRRQA